MQIQGWQQAEGCATTSIESGHGQRIVFMRFRGTDLVHLKGELRDHLTAVLGCVLHGLPT